MDPPYFTINACNRCRKRKARCDTQIPACQPCQNSGSICEYTDGRSGEVHPRSFIHDLESQWLHLEHQLEEIGQTEVEESPATSTLRSDDEHAQDLIRVDGEGHAHFIGASSGMYLVRSVLESAQQKYPTFDSPSESTDVPQAGPKETAINNTTIALPSRETANSLIDTFFSQYQVQYPILDQTEFSKSVSEFYDRQDAGANNSESSPDDVWTRFMLNMVLAISLIFMSNDHDDSLTISKGFTANAMADVSLIMQTKNVQSVQCLLLLLLLSILDSTSAPVWYISGLCMRMCIDLGYHSEKTIAISSSAKESNMEKVNEADTKRRLFWITFSFDRTLNILLGRPFTFDDFTVDIHLPEQSLLPRKRRQILHWLELQRIQSEIVHKLHTVRIDATRLEQDETELSQWTKEMALRLNAWNSVAQTLTDSDGHNINWWGYWYRTALLILYRPSPSRPNLNAIDTLSCYLAAKDLIQLSFLRISEGLMDFTWVDLHFQFMSGITLVFIVWKSTEARAKAKEDWVSFKTCRWERIARAREALSKLADATIDLVEKELVRSAGGGQNLPIQHNLEEVRRDQLESQTQQSSEQNMESIHLPGSSVCPVDTRSDGVEPEHGYNTTMNDNPHQAGSANIFPPQSSAEGWANISQPASIEQRNLFEDGQLNNMSSLPTEELWPLFDLSDIAAAPDELNFWTYFSAPMLGVDDMATSQFNPISRPDETFTNSILNFHGDLSNMTHHMPIEYVEEGDYMQGYHAGQ
ncbi:fungal-specific transcription factor domain-containing protein [Fusarium avenaceum]|nr:fungal-specific transcription factor domain-containing protein [Fusarium avenaceum]